MSDARIPVELSPDELSRLSWLCDARVAKLREWAAIYSDDPDCCAAADDATYFAALAVRLRAARDA